MIRNARFVWNDGSKYEALGTASDASFHVAQKDVACQGELLGGRRNGEGCYQSHDGKDLRLPCESFVAKACKGLRRLKKYNAKL